MLRWPAAIGLFLLAGCGGGDPYDHVQVSGKVTYDDGSLIPADRIELVFDPQAKAIDAKTHARSGHAQVDVATGEFDRVTTHKPNDGLVRGKHKVVVRAFKGEFDMSLVPQEYQDSAATPLTADTEDPASFQFKVRKPE